MSYSRKYIISQDIRGGVWNALDRLIGSILTPAVGRTVTGATVAATSDIGSTIRANSASAVAITLPNDATGGWVGDSIISVYQAGVGTVSFTAGSGVTLRSPTGIPTSVQYGIVSALRISANEWTLV